ncbi:hypothetical protein NSMM_150117 [Nitrosomonas mobilis]|uniref:Uncharacterized protein n=1 Tax=Nitrosomonas mobilis TaxID=51642 RepID=A0A1G5SD83_9PROT|nr:hypothetical protein NSMM_150117 [Nitrosomonas mobilis]
MAICADNRTRAAMLRFEAPLLFLIIKKNFICAQEKLLYAYHVTHTRTLTHDIRRDTTNCNTS